jgi:hypothetical protein
MEYKEEKWLKYHIGLKNIGFYKCLINVCQDKVVNIIVIKFSLSTSTALYRKELYDIGAMTVQSLEFLPINN